MSNETNNLIPAFRFPEFENYNEWEYFNGNEIFMPISDKNHDSNLPILAITQEYGAIPRNMIDYHVSVLDKSVENYKIVEKGDFIISLRSFQGGIEYSNYKGICSPAYVILRKKTGIVNDFYRYYFKSRPFIKDLNKNLEGIRDGKMISYGQFSEILIPKPSAVEQQKIASCLSSLDDLITAHRNKLEALKAHKKGLMQNLFPQEGERVPKYRFPEFGGDREWVENKLGELGQFLGGGTPDRSNLDFWKGDIPWISSSDINEDDIHNISITRFINDCALRDSATKIIPKGSVLFVSRVGVGKLAINKREICTSQDFTSFIPVSVHNYFIGYYISAKKNLLHHLVQGTSIKGFSKNDLENMPILHPEKIEEQIKISSCLSALEQLIAVQMSRIERLQLHKKGLMQGLFPTINN